MLTLTARSRGFKNFALIMHEMSNYVERIVRLGGLRPFYFDLFPHLASRAVFLFC